MKFPLELACATLLAMTLGGCTGDGLMSLDLSAVPSDGFYDFGPGSDFGYGYPDYFGSPMLAPGFGDDWDGSGYWGDDDDD